jgi:hypothetical protein
MNLKPRKGNVIAGILAFIIVYLLYFISENYVSGRLISGNKPISQEIIIAISLVIGVISYIIASLGCCCCKSNDKEKASGKKGAE